MSFSNEQWLNQGGFSSSSLFLSTAHQKPSPADLLLHTACAFNVSSKCGSLLSRTKLSFLSLFILIFYDLWRCPLQLFIFPWSPEKEAIFCVVCACTKIIVDHIMVEQLLLYDCGSVLWWNCILQRLFTFACFLLSIHTQTKQHSEFDTDDRRQWAVLFSLLCKWVGMLYGLAENILIVASTSHLHTSVLHDF